MDIHRSNLIIALATAILEEEKYHKKQDYTHESAYLAGLRITLQHIRSGGQINLI